MIWPRERVFFGFPWSRPWGWSLEGGRRTNEGADGVMRMRCADAMGMLSESNNGHGVTTLDGSLDQGRGVEVRSRRARVP